MISSSIIIPLLSEGAGAFCPEGGKGRTQVAGDWRGRKNGNSACIYKRSTREAAVFFCMCLFIGTQMDF